jgi:hypothetical protein
MSKQFRFPVIRRSIIEETFWIDADSEEEALDLARDGNYDEKRITTEWVDWYDDEFSMDPNLEPEPLCPLYQMVKEHSCATS